MNKWSNIKKSLLQDPEVKHAYEELELEYQVVSEVIRLRKTRKLTQQELAEKVGTTQSAIARLETGRANPTVEFLSRLAKALQTKITVSFS